MAPSKAAEAESENMHRHDQHIASPLPEIFGFAVALGEKVESRGKGVR